MLGFLPYVWVHQPIPHKKQISENEAICALGRKLHCRAHLFTRTLFSNVSIATLRWRPIKVTVPLINQNQKIPRGLNYIFRLTEPVIFYIIFPSAVSWNSLHLRLMWCAGDRRRPGYHSTIFQQTFSCTASSCPTGWLGNRRANPDSSKGQLIQRVCELTLLFANKLNIWPKSSEEKQRDGWCTYRQLL